MPELKPWEMGIGMILSLEAQRSSNNMGHHHQAGSGDSCRRKLHHKKDGVVELATP